MKIYSQSGQDVFVLSMFPKGYKGVFLDIGCQMPERINNTLMLEERGWDGLSVDIVDYSEEWKLRKTPFMQVDILKDDLEHIWDRFYPNFIDYINLDISPYGGARFEALKRITNLGFGCKVLTIEHDAYKPEHHEKERIPQRELLNSLGYFLINPDVTCGGNAYDDWWINPKYIKI